MTADAGRLHPLLAARWSPIQFDDVHEVTDADVDTLLEAARWAPSAGNSQPWAFWPARRGDPMHARLLPYLAGSSAVWARTAALLVVNLCHRFVEDTEWDYSEFALYDLGQAVAHMTIQAQAMSLFARQFRAFRRAGLAAELAVPEHWQVTTITAFGRPAPGAEPGEMAATPPRERRPLRATRWPDAGTAERDGPLP